MGQNERIFTPNYFAVNYETMQQERNFNLHVTGWHPLENRRTLGNKRLVKIDVLKSSFHLCNILFGKKNFREIKKKINLRIWCSQFISEQDKKQLQRLKTWLSFKSLAIFYFALKIYICSGSNFLNSTCSCSCLCMYII